MTDDTKPHGEIKYLKCQHVKNGWYVRFRSQISPLEMLELCEFCYGNTKSGVLQETLTTAIKFSGTIKK